jgi:hypothetical protein
MKQLSIQQIRKIHAMVCKLDEAMDCLESLTSRFNPHAMCSTRVNHPVSEVDTNMRIPSVTLVKCAYKDVKGVLQHLTKEGVDVQPIELRLDNLVTEFVKRPDWHNWND